MADGLREAALYYHQFPKLGKLAIEPTKPLVTQRDLSLAHSPGVVFACIARQRPEPSLGPDGPGV
jgi:malate dehydrogenase (oxaloacetate-decarboxylating)(NADP+)